MNASDIPSILLGLAIYTAPVAAFYALKVPYLLTVRSALTACHPRNRRMSPNAVWLELIPLFGYFWHFWTMNAIADSLRDEYDDRDLTPTFGFGLRCGWRGQFVLPLLAVPGLNVVAAIILGVCVLMYWLTMHVHASTLRADDDRRAACNRVMKAVLVG